MPRTISVELVADESDLLRSFRRASTGAERFNRDMQRTFRGVVAGSGAFRSLGRSVAFASSAFLGGVGLTAAIKTSIDAASNLNEQVSKSNVVFGASARSVENWSKTTVQSMGLAQDQALETASSFGALLRPIGVTGQAAAAQSRKLTQLGADLASFYNTSVQDALDAIRSGLVGEVEPLRRYGVLLSETRVQQEALRETGKEHAQDLTVQEKLLARLTLIYRDTAQAQGDFARTSGGLANQQRILQANIRQLQISVGRALLPTVLQIVKAMNQWLERSENQKRVVDAVKSAVAIASDVFRTLRGILAGLNKVTGSTTNTVKLLLAAFVAFKTAKIVGLMADVAASVGRIGGNAKGARGEVKTLRGSLLGLAGMRIAIPVTLAVAGSVGLGAFLKWARRGLPGGQTGGGGAKLNPNDPTTWPAENLAAFAAQHGRGTYDWYLKHPALAMQIARRSLAAQRPTAAGAGRPWLRVPRLPTVAPAAAPSLSAAQQRAIGLAGTPGLAALRAQASYDRAALAFLDKRFRAGKISAAKYTAAVVKFRDDLAQQTSAITSILEQQAQDAKSRTDAARARARKAAERTKAEMKRAHWAPGFESVLRRGIFRAAAAGERATQFQVAPRLELAQARAEALGLPVAPILRRMRAAARAALRSGLLTIESQTEAWNAIKAVNDELKQGAVLTYKQQRALAKRTGIAYGSRYQFAAQGAGTTIQIEHFHTSAKSVREIEDSTVKRGRARAHVRRGAR